MANISELKRFDVTEYLDSEQAIVEYLTIVLEENDPALPATKRRESSLPTALLQPLHPVSRLTGRRACRIDTGLT